MARLTQGNSARRRHGTILIAYQREALVQPGTLLKPSLDEAPVSVELPRTLYRRLGKLVAGDEIEYETQARAHTRGGHRPIVTDLLPRRAEFYRGGAAGRSQLLFTNLEQLVICCSPVQPEFRPGLIDRLLIAATAQELAAVLVLNKRDLAAPETAAALLATYRALGYRCLEVSATEGGGLEELREELRGKTSALVGHSGVGKSSLINRLVPGSAQRVGSVLEGTGKGQHTTTRSRLLPLEGGGFLLDSPGIRMFGLDGLQPLDVAGLFPDFREMEACRFTNCLHLTEGDCGVRQAIDQNRMSQERSVAYQKLLYSLDPSLPVCPEASGSRDEEVGDEEAGAGIDEDAEILDLA